MAMIFIDCGAYKGKITRRFKAKHPDSECHAFECHPHFDKINYGDNVNTHRVAVWTYNGTMPLYVNHKTPGVEGHSAFPDKTTNHIDPFDPIMVKCIDFGNWLLTNFSGNNSTLHVKMNIEGSEYPVLEKCIFDGSIKLIKYLYVQWHYMKIPSISRERHIKLVNDLAKISSLTVYNGYRNL